MKKFLLPMMLLALTATSVNAQRLSAGERSAAKVEFAAKQLNIAKEIKSPMKVADNQSLIGYDGSASPAIYGGFPSWESVSMVLSDIYEENLLKEYAGWKIVGMRFAVAASLGNKAYAFVQIYKDANDEGAEASVKLTDSNYEVSPNDGTNVTGVAWNEVAFDEPYTITGEEQGLMYGYQYTQVKGDGTSLAENPILFGQSSSTDYKNMCLVYGKPSASYDEGLYYVSSAKNSFVPCFQIIIQKPGGDDTAVIGINGSDSPVTAQKYFSLDGTRLSAPQKGLNIVKMSDGTTRKVMK